MTQIARRILKSLKAWGGQAKQFLYSDTSHNGQNREVVHEQSKLLYILSLWFGGTGAVNCVLTSFIFGAWHNPLISINAFLIIFIYAMIVHNAQSWKRSGDDTRFIRRAQTSFAVLGFAWGCLINLFALYGQPAQAGLLVGLASAVVSTPIISVPAAVAFGFFVPEAALSVVAVSITMPTAEFYTSVAFISLVFYVAAVTLYSNKMFIGRSVARHALQREIETVNVFLREYEEGSSDWLWSTYVDGVVHSASPRMLSAMRISLEQAQQHRLQDLVTTETDADNRPAGDLASFFLRKFSFRDHLVRYQIDNEARWFALTGHPVADRKGTIIGFRGIGRDVTKTHTAAKEIKFLANHDSLTGLLNRRSFIETADKLCADNQPFALALIDLDSFKAVNDSFGHNIGDSLLRNVAARIRHQIRPFDIAARLGGDEFAVIIRDADETLGHTIADRLVASLSERFETAGISLIPGASLGISASPNQGSDTVRLLMLADLALYKAKESGKGTVRVFAGWMEEEHRVQMTKEADLLNAIENGQIVVAYQPIVDIATGQVVSGEALVRWQHPTRGTIMPGEFIPIAERNDLIERLGELVLRVACRDAASWNSPIQVNVNVSPRQFKSGRFPQILVEALEESQLPPHRLGLEVTETLLLDSTGKMLKQLQSFRDLGIKLVLDDFGSGYSSLSYLHKIDVDGIKLDADFIKKLPDRKVAAIYRMVATLAADLNIYVVAEGIEESGQLEWLKKNGIQFGQGYLLGRPELSPPTKKIEYLMR